MKKSPNYAMCWSINWSTPEILAANKGRCEPGGVASRLTKRMAFSRFSKLYKNETGRRDNFADLTYHEAKQVASDYQVRCVSVYLSVLVHVCLEITRNLCDFLYLFFRKQKKNS